ncbi:S-adenosyl-L-methionine-dependent methyltransferase, partial [Wilcoxina mikolae CBS 423.85]
SSNPESETFSLLSTYKQTVEINGRIYQQLALEKGTSFTPTDECERDRLDRQHQMFQLVFNDRLIFPPIQNPGRILDCGYGSGAWCFDVAEKYPDCQVIGVDITPHMRPDEIPRNLWLQVDDLNEPFTFQEEFDLVHSRNVAPGINYDRWQSYIQDCVRVVKPGGWLQFTECYHLVQSDNGTITDDHAIRKLTTRYTTAMEGKKDVRAPMRLESMMRGAGLVEIQSRMIQLPMNGWPSTPREREIGEIANEVYKEALGSYVQYLFAEVLGMSMDEIEALVARAQQDLDNKSLKPYIGL